MRRLTALAAAVCLLASCAGDDATQSPTATTGSAPSATGSPLDATGSGPAPTVTPIGSPETSTPDAASSPTTAAATPVPASGEPSPASPAATPSGPARTPGEGEFTNPVIGRDFPDPHVIRAGDEYFAYSTTSAGTNIRFARSADLVAWDIVGEALPQLASWSGLTPLFSSTPHKATWAPAVATIGDRFVMYYTTPALELPRPDRRPSQCIGVATSGSPEGPFVDDSDEPIVCQSDLGGSIDATYFADEDGSQHLIWKNDGNCCGVATRFFIQELTDDGLQLVGEPTDMGVSNDVLWERLVIEAPTLWRHEDTYYLFYSGNDFGSAAYAVGYATSENVLGPYVDAPENPILKTVLPAAGPGHQSIVEDADGDLWMTYHAWDFAYIGYPQGRRAMWIDELVFEDGRAVVLGPDVGPQPAPHAASD